MAHSSLLFWTSISGLHRVGCLVWISAPSLACWVTLRGHQLFSVCGQFSTCVTRKSHHVCLSLAVMRIEGVMHAKCMEQRAGRSKSDLVLAFQIWLDSCQLGTPGSLSNQCANQDIPDQTQVVTTSCINALFHPLNYTFMSCVWGNAGALQPDWVGSSLTFLACMTLDESLRASLTSSIYWSSWSWCWPPCWASPDWEKKCFLPCPVWASGLGLIITGARHGVKVKLYS